MAKRRKHYRGFGDMVALPLSDIMDDITGSVTGVDALTGAAAGALAGMFAINWTRNNFWVKKGKTFPAMLQRFTPLLAGGVTGLAMYFLDGPLGMSKRKAGHLVGGIAAGVALQASQEAKAKFPQYYSDVVDLRLAGLIVNDQERRRGMNGYNSFLIDDPARPFAGLNGYADNPNLADLAALSMGLQEDDADLQDIGLDS